MISANLANVDGRRATDAPPQLLASIIIVCLMTMVFLPSVNFSLMETEIFPWATFFVVLACRRFDYAIVAVCLYLITLTLFAVVISDSANFGESLRSLAAYLNCLLVFAAICAAPMADVRLMSKVGLGLFCFLLLLGVLQTSGMLEPLDALFKFLIPRASATPLSLMGGRGATLLSSEPARAGIELVSFYVLFRVLIICANKKLQLLGDALLGIFLLLIIKSAQCVLFYLVFIGVFYNVRVIRLAPVLAVGLFVIAWAGLLDGRVFVLFQDIVKEGSIGDALFLLSNTSGHRVTSIISSYGYGFSHPFGGGIGNWMTSSVVALQESGVRLSELRYFQLYGGGYAIPIRSSGYVTNLVLDVGIVGIVPVVYVIHRAFRSLRAYQGAALAVTLVFILKICFFGSVGNPVVWVTTALCLRMLAAEQLMLNDRSHGPVNKAASS